MRSMKRRIPEKQCSTRPPRDPLAARFASLLKAGGRLAKAEAAKWSEAGE